MAFRRPIPSGGVSFDMTPASDIIFTLLLFFILTQQALPLMKTELPAVGAFQAPEEAKPLCIELTASGSIVWDGTSLPDSSWESALASCARQIPASSAIIIEVDRKAPAGTAVELLDRLQAAGITKVAFAGRNPDSNQPHDTP